MHLFADPGVDVLCNEGSCLDFTYHARVCVYICICVFVTVCMCVCAYVPIYLSMLNANT